MTLREVRRTHSIIDSHGFVDYEPGDRSILEQNLTDDFTFSAPLAWASIARRTSSRCWPNSERTKAFEFKRLLKANDEVFVTYESTTTDGRRFRNTESLGFDGDKISRVDVYFGWNVE